MQATESLLREHRALVLFAIAASICLSVASVVMDDVINNDGVEYVRAAQAFMEGRWSDGLSYHRWPFYSLGVAVLGTVTGLDPEYAAHVLNAALTAVLVAAFLALIAELGGGRSTLVAATFVILLFPGINDYRSFVIRDPGYLAFYLVAAIYLLRFHRRGRWRDAVAWLVSMALATAFRVEGVVFLMLIPLLAAYARAAATRQRIGIALLAVGAVALLLTAFAWWVVAPAELAARGAGQGAAGSLLGGAWGQIGSDLADKLRAIEVEFLDEFSSGYAYVVFALTLMVIVVAEVLSNLTPWFALLVGYAWYRRDLFPAPEGKLVWLWLIAVNVGVLVLFTIVKLFLTGRYPAALTLTLLVAAPFGLTDLYESWRDRVVGQRWLFPIAAAVILVAGIEGLGLYTSKQHVKAAGQWLSESTPAEARLLSNDKILIYYSDRPTGRYRLLKDWPQVLGSVRRREHRDYDYLAIRIKKGDRHRRSRLINMIGKKPVKVFDNGDRDRVLVFEI